MKVVLGKADFFTTFNLKNGYWQIPIDENDKPIDENDKEKTAFTCHRGLYEYIAFWVS